MNAIKKIGLSALAASLVATSVSAVEMSVSGAAALYFTGGDKDVDGNGWTMNDNIAFSGGGELDNGWTVTANFLLDNSDAQTGGVFDNRQIAINMNDMGTLSFWGKAGDGVVTATDDKLPNMYEESWYGADSPNTGAANDDMFYYSNASLVDGLTVMASYVPSGAGAAATEIESSSDIGATYSSNGFTFGLATGEDKGAGSASAVENTNMWLTYAYGPVTIGYQSNESDSKVADADEEFTAMVVTYTVSPDISISYGTSEIDYQNNAISQESKSFGASYTMGSMTFSGVHNTHENISGLDTDIADKDVYEIGLAFAF